MTVQKTEQYAKRVRFAKADEERQVATGVVMVPDKVDLQGDYVRAETIEQFAEEFMTRLSGGEEPAEGGIMHAVWPDEHMSLVENTVLGQSREIAGEDVPAGAWVQSWKFDDNELWTLVRDGILTGYSIGAREVDWSAPMDQDELPDDVAVAEDYPEDEPAWQLQDGSVVEVSSVDIPAVPDAEILATKDDAEKRVADYLGDREGFMEEMAERGHSEGDAERLWNYLQRAVDEDGATDVEESAGWLARAKAYFSSGGGATDSEGADKESRTLSQSNRERLMAAHDAVEDALASDVDFPKNRFTDNPAVDFDVADYEGKTLTGDGDGGTDNGGKDAAGDDMTDENEPPEWATDLKDSIEANSKRIEEALAADGDGEKSGDGGDGDGGDGEKDAFDDAPEWAKELKEATEQNAQRIDDVAKASGTSQQIDGAGAATQSTRKYDKSWDDTLGLPTEGDA